MFKRFLHNGGLYALTVFNVIHAIETNTFDWLLWLSIALCVITFILSAVMHVMEVKENA